MEGTTILFPEERRLAILERVNHDGRAAVAELSKEFGVSEVTIRADLQLLTDHMLIVRTHGGAVPINRIPETSLTLRRHLQVSEKERIGQTGAAMVANGEAIFLDTSSTALALANHLKQHRDLTIITNSLAVAQTMLDAMGVTVVMPGGTLQRDTISLIGTDGLNLLQNFNIQKGFFGAHGLCYPEGLTDVSKTEVEVKQHMIKMCREVIAILDATKWGRVGLASFARMEDLNCIITDNKAPGDMVKQAYQFGIKVIKV
jgi:DeoR family transcriptional regulator of aga operon/DeoR family fructose operon transcriptional repressor